MPHTPAGEFDAIRDRGINQGIGGSGLARQSLQRANLPTLRQSLAESTATRREAERLRISGFRSEVAANQQGIIQQLGQNKSNALGQFRPPGSLGATTPQATLTRLAGGPFVLTAPTAGGVSTTEQLFKTQAELENFLKANPQIRQALVAPGIGQQSIPEDVRIALKLPRVTAAQGRGVLGKGPPAGLATGLRKLQSIVRTVGGTNETQSQLTEEARQLLKEFELLESVGSSGRRVNRKASASTLKGRTIVASVGRGTRG